MGSVGDAYDNAMAESFFATLECELVDRRRFRTQTEARMAVFRFIEGWYNPYRRHSGLDYESPVSFETKHREAASQPWALGPLRRNQPSRNRTCFYSPALGRSGSF